MYSQRNGFSRLLSYVYMHNLICFSAVLFASKTRPITGIKFVALEVN